ncbi:hypothetical protein [Cryobacterium sp. M15]|jgi:hypothetical protein|uniref:hypothetical protein n=1 Tax=Cryobacterium sp. M15 TaxID=2048291 RepID=UPI000CE3388C|nr:hypothetical protein [Cryobacterium sp. M15]
MFSRESQPELQIKLEAADAAVAAHPLAAERIKRAHAIIESTDSADKDLVEQKLAEEGLPDLAEIGLIQVRNSVSWWKLHRERNKITDKLEKLDS